MASSKPKSSKHIDDGKYIKLFVLFSKITIIIIYLWKYYIAEQFPTAEEHYSYLMNNEEVVDAEFTEVTAKNLPDWYDPELFKR